MQAATQLKISTQYGPKHSDAWYRQCLHTPKRSMKHLRQCSRLRWHISIWLLHRSRVLLRCCRIRQRRCQCRHCPVEDGAAGLPPRQAQQSLCPSVQQHARRHQSEALLMQAAAACRCLQPPAVTAAGTPEGVDPQTRRKDTTAALRRSLAPAQRSSLLEPAKYGNSNVILAAFADKLTIWSTTTEPGMLHHGLPPHIVGILNIDSLSLTDRSTAPPAVRYTLPALATTTRCARWPRVRNVYLQDRCQSLMSV